MMRDGISVCNTSKRKSDVKQMQRELHASYDDGAVVSEFVWLAGDLMRYRPTVKMICVLLCM
jgi:ATP-dependent helicase/DNAse subunit B